VFLFFYLFLATILYIVALPFLAFFVVRPKYKESLPARFFLKNNRPFEEGDIHFHTCSYGEAKAIKPLIDRFKEKKMNLSAITQTGYLVLQEYSKNVRYLPYEIFLPKWYKREKVLVVVEAELWYMLFFIAKQRGAKTFLINARISSRSYPKYKKFKWFYKQIFKYVDSIYAQSFDDAKRLATLGAKNIKVSGNIKFLNIQKATKSYQKEYPLIVTAASTHEGEEEGILKAFLALKSVENAQLIVVPRHPERFEKVAAFLKREANKHALSFHQFSQRADFKSDIVLVDCMGELINIYKFSDIVILGGAFVEVGGHNALEAAQFGCKIISGPNYFNQIDIFNAVKGIEITELDLLTETLLNYRAIKKSKTEIKATIDALVKEIESVL